MGFIYKITNSENDKIYIGYTRFNIDKRWKEHRKDCRNKNRPIYQAMRELGFDKFNISVVEEVPNNMLNQREKFWIKQFNSKENGYNYTYGGKGSKTIDDNIVIKEYNKLKNIKKVSEKLNISEKQISKILKKHNIEIDLSETFKHLCKPVLMFKNNELLKSFSSIKDSAQYLFNEKIIPKDKIRSTAGHIAEVCNNVRKTCRGYVFKFK